MSLEELNSLIEKVRKEIPSEMLKGLVIEEFESIAFGNAIRIASGGMSYTLSGEVEFEKEMDKVTLKSGPSFAIFSHLFHGVAIGSHV